MTWTASRPAPPESGASGEAAADSSLGWLLLLGGLVGLVAAGVLLVEKIILITNPAYVPSCSINPVLSCGSIMSTPQAELLGFPNPIIGVAAFPVLAATGAAVLGRAVLPRWYWGGLQVGVTAGAALVAWLIFQSLYRIGALCPYCMVVWAVVLPIALYVTLHNARAGLWGEGVATSRVVTVARDSHVLILALLLVAVLGLVLQRFWPYWSSLI